MGTVVTAGGWIAYVIGVPRQGLVASKATLARLSGSVHRQDHDHHGDRHRDLCRRHTARSPISAGFVALGLATFRQRDLQFPRDDPIPPLSARRLQGPAGGAV
jgi:hypothetical protein